MNTTSINTLTTSEAAFAGGLVGTFAIAAIVMCILLIIAQWKIFEKAGEKGWKSLIPIYGQYILFKIVGAKLWFWGFLCLSIVCSIMMSANAIPIDYNASQEVIEAQLNAINWNQHIPFLIGAIVTCIASLVIDIVLAIKIAKAFGKGLAYILGLIFFPGIVLLVLGFGKAKYSAKNLK